MSEVRENLLTRMIRIYGFENDITIQFAKLLEDWEENDINNRMLLLLVMAHEDYPQF